MNAEAAPVAVAVVAEERKDDGFQRESGELELPNTQSALLLHAIRQPYEYSSAYSIPLTKHDHEVLVKVKAAGLNPIDWKAPSVYPETFYLLSLTLI